MEKFQTYKNHILFLTYLNVVEQSHFWTNM